jgi:predicted nucleic acid-binding Zn ribbon protein
MVAIVPRRPYSVCGLRASPEIFGLIRESVYIGEEFFLPENECAQPVYQYIVAMPTYIYETTDPAKPIRTFEVKQSVHDEPLRSDPETGEGARRVISAGYNVLVRGKSVGPSVGSVGSH